MMSRIPDQLRNQLPNELSEAEIVGVETADVDENVRLWGPPGTGKSTQSALRTATRAMEDGLPSSAMTVVTYRKSLAGVVKERLLDWGLFDDDAEFKYWTTIHAAASRATDFHERFDPDNDDDLEGMVARKAEYRFCKKMGIRKKPPNPWQETRWTVFKDLYDYGKSNLLAVGEYQNVPESALRSVHSDAVAGRKLKAFHSKWGGGADFQSVALAWEDFKQYHNCYDFHEQLTAALSGPLPPMQHVVIDEYHDATPLMAAVTERWAQNAETCIVAGDPDQVVNAYAGADPGFFERLGERTGLDIPVVKLGKSWRCPDEHFSAAAEVLSQERTPPQLDTAGPGKMNRWPTGQFWTDSDDDWHYPSEGQEGSPAWLWERFGPDIMFLLRTQKQAGGVAAALDSAGVIYRSQSSVGGDWETRLDLLNALDLLTDVRPPTSSAPEGVATLGDSSESNLDNYAFSKEQAIALWEHSSGHYKKSEGDWNTFIGAVEEGGTVGLAAWDNLVKDKWWLRYTNGQASIAEMVYLDQRDKRAMHGAWERYEFPQKLEDVATRVLTIHASKGAEASNVVLYDGITGRVRDGMESSDILRENEARTWYVGLTRASERLHLIRDAFDYAEDYLPRDLEPVAASTAKRLRGEAHE